MKTLALGFSVLALGLSVGSVASAGPLADEYGKRLSAERKSDFNDFIDSLKCQAEEISGSKAVSKPEYVTTADVVDADAGELKTVQAVFFKMADGQICKIKYLGWQRLGGDCK